jgi:hypothetical protein
LISNPSTISKITLFIKRNGIKKWKKKEIPKERLKATTNKIKLNIEQRFIDVIYSTSYYSNSLRNIYCSFVITINSWHSEFLLNNFFLFLIHFLLFSTHFLLYFKRSWSAKNNKIILFHEQKTKQEKCVA